MITNRTFIHSIVHIVNDQGIALVAQWKSSSPVTTEEVDGSTPAHYMSYVIFPLSTVLYQVLIKGSLLWVFHMSFLKILEKLAKKCFWGLIFWDLCRLGHANLDNSYNCREFLWEASEDWVDFGMRWKKRKRKKILPLPCLFQFIFHVIFHYHLRIQLSY